MFMLTLRARRICLALVATLIMPSVAHAADVVLVEEHWKLVVGGPDEGRSAPQVSLVMSPVENLNDHYFLVTLNHWNASAFSSGGAQVQYWHADNCVSATAGLNKAPLGIDGEVITWTQRIRLAEGRLTFEIVDGQSQSWGPFGGDGSLQVSVPTNLARLNNYRPAVSLNESGIGYAGNRVSSLTLQKLVWKTADGQTQEAVAPIDIATRLDGKE